LWQLIAERVTRFDNASRGAIPSTPRFSRLFTSRSRNRRDSKP